MRYGYVTRIGYFDFNGYMRTVKIGNRIYRNTAGAGILRYADHAVFKRDAAKKIFGCNACVTSIYLNNRTAA